MGKVCPTKEHPGKKLDWSSGLGPKLQVLHFFMAERGQKRTQEPLKNHQIMSVGFYFASHGQGKTVLLHILQEASWDEQHVTMEKRHPQNNSMKGQELGRNCGLSVNYYMLPHMPSLNWFRIISPYMRILGPPSPNMGYWLLFSASLILLESNALGYYCNRATH